MPDAEFKKVLEGVPGLKELVNEHHGREDKTTKLLLMEFALYGLAEYSQISKNNIVNGLQFKDRISGMFSLPTEEESGDEDEDALGGTMNQL